MKSNNEIINITCGYTMVTSYCSERQSLIAMIEIYFRAQPKCYQIRMPSLFLVENCIEMSLEVVHQSSLEIPAINKLCILI